MGDCSVSIPFAKVPSRIRRASEIDRDNAALVLVGYIAGILHFSPDGISDEYRAGLILRINKVRATQGIGRAMIVNETPPKIREAATPIIPNKVKESI